MAAAAAASSALLTVVVEAVEAAAGSEPNSTAADAEACGYGGFGQHLLFKEEERNV